MSLQHTDYERMTTKKRPRGHRLHRIERALNRATGKRRAPWVKTTADKAKATLKKTATLRDLVGAAMDNGMRVEVSLENSPPVAPLDLSGCGFGTPREDIQAAIDSKPDNYNHQFEVYGPTPEQARKIGEQIREQLKRSPLTRNYGGPECAWRPSFNEGVAAHEEAEAWNQFRAYNQADDKPVWGKFGIADRVHGYMHLEEVLSRAYLQAASGKGQERHGRGLTFDAQPTQVISDLLDSDAGLAFQAIKKVNEGMRLEHDAKIKEMLGAINYIASIVIRMERNKNG